MKIEELPCGWTKDNVRLSHKILLRKLTPAALEKMCPTTQSLAETIGVIVEEAAGAEMFTLDLHMPSWHFTNSDNKVTVSVCEKFGHISRYIYAGWSIRSCITIW